MNLQDRKKEIEDLITELGVAIFKKQTELTLISNERNQLMIDISNTSGHEQGLLSAELIDLDEVQMNEFKLISIFKNEKIGFEVELAQVKFRIIRGPLMVRFKKCTKNNSCIVKAYPGTSNWQIKVRDLIGLDDNDLFLEAVELLEAANSELQSEHTGRTNLKSSAKTKLSNLGFSEEEIKLIIG